MKQEQYEKWQGGDINSAHLGTFLVSPGALVTQVENPWPRYVGQLPAQRNVMLNFGCLFECWYEASTN